MFILRGLNGEGYQNMTEQKPMTVGDLKAAIKDLPDSALVLIRMVWCNSPTLLDYKLNVKDGCHPVFEITEDFAND